MLRSWKLSTTTAYNVISSLLNGNYNLFFQQTRTTYILKRKNKTRLYKKEDAVRKLKRQDFFYEVVENTEAKKKPPLDLILLQDVKEFGDKGQRISVSQMIGYHKLLLPKLAVYATLENIKKYEIHKQEENTQLSSKYVSPLLEILKRCCLSVYMSSKNEWELEKRHVKVSFRMAGIHLMNQSIEMPKHIIRGPNFDYEGKEFYVIITVNKNERVTVRCRLFHINNEKLKYDEEPDFFMKPGSAIFSEDQLILDSLPRPKWEDTWNSEKFA